MRFYRNSTLAAGLGVLALMGSAAPAAHATVTITNLYDTGFNSSGVIADESSDAHYTITATPDGSTPPTLVRTSAGGFPLPPSGPYIGDSSTSAWIGPNYQAGVQTGSTYVASRNDLSGPAGNYTYTTTFDVSGLTGPGLFQISGNWATDNTGQSIVVDGVSYAQTAPGFRSYTPFSIDALLNNGSNTLSFNLDNIPGNTDNPTALRVDGLNVSAAPEPSQVGMLALMGLGLGGLIFKARKAKPVTA